MSTAGELPPPRTQLRLVDGPAPPPPDEPDERPEVRLSPNVAENVDALDSALALSDPMLYSRARQLVHVLPAIGIPGVADETPVVRQMSPPALLLHVSRHLRCVRYEQPDASAIKLASKGGPTARGEWTATVPSGRLAIEPMLAQGHWKHIRPLRAVVESPTLRPDGSVLQTPGYDVASGYLYAPSCEFPDIPPAPTQEQAKSALWELAQVFGDFPHVSLAHRMVPIAALLTILARAAIDGPTPAFIFDATVRGSGKTLQGDVVHAIAQGRRAAHGTLAAQEEEREKALSGYALSAARVVFIDNVKGLLGGPKLEATLTSTVVSFRILGKMDIAELPWLATILVSGNNLQMTDDMVRRCLLSRLESPLEDPTTRTEFAHPELVAWSLSERPRLLALALTVLRAFVSHGSPDAGQGTLGEPYGPWCRLVAGSILFAGGANPLECRPPRESAGIDEVSAIRVLLDGWRKLDPSNAGQTVAQIARKLSPQGPHDAPDGLDDLREAAETIAPPRTGSKVDARALGYVLRRQRGRWIGGRRFVMGGIAHGNTLTWRIEEQSKARG